jgi:DNA-binding SARP family transcriptional activator
MAKLNLTLLGGFQARLEPGSALALPTRKAQALLAYLALPAGRAHPRDKLAALLWGGTREESARASLRQALFSIRKALEPAEGVLGQAGDALALSPAAVEVDAARFERAVQQGTPEALARAAELYAGDLLDGFVIDEAPFEEWLLGERERLRELALEALARLLAHQRKSGATEPAIQTARRLLALDPLQEPVHRALMRLYAEAGRRGAALRQYQQCVSALGRELGIEPEAETKALYQDILRQRAPSRVARDAVALAETGASFRTPSVEIPLVGRAVELTRLCAMLESPRAEGAAMIALLGEAGIGKTRLVSELIATSEGRGVPVLVGRCYESEHVLPFGPWVDASRTAPAIGDALQTGGDFLEVFKRVTAAIAELAGGRRLLVVLEDVHWADEMSLRLLAFLGRRLPELHVTVAVTAREEELVDAVMLRRILDELRREGRLASLALPPLTRDDTFALVQMLARQGTDAGMLGRLGETAWKASAGNPFVAVETVRSHRVGAGLPESVRQVTVSRLERLSERARELMTAAAVIGREFEFGLLRQASGLEEAEAAAGVEELVRRRVLQGVGERFDFTHDRVRDVVLDGLLAPRRRILHRAVAEAIETLHRDALEPHVLALGLHYHRAEMWSPALTHLRRAATGAFAQSAYRESSVSFERALDAAAHLPASREMLAEMLEMRLQLRTALWPLADFERIAACLAEAERLAVSLEARPQLVRVTAYQTVLRWIIGDFRTALRLGESARTAALAFDDWTLRAMSNYYTGLAQLLLGQYEGACAALLENVPTLDVASEPYVLGAPRSHLVQAAAWVVIPLTERGEFRDGLAHGRKALELAEAANDIFGIVTAAYGLAYLHCQREEFEPAIPLLERGVTICREREFSVWLPQHTGYLGYAYARGGRTDEGLALLEHAIEVFESTHAWPFRTLLTAHRGAASLLAGRVEAARGFGHEALTLAREHGERGHEAWALRLLGEVAAHGDRKEAERWYREAATQAGELGMRPLLARCQLELGTLLARGGSRSEARERLTAAAALYGELQMDAARAEAEAALA